MSMDSAHVVILGGGAAGTVAAERLGEKGFHVSIITDERYPYYSRSSLIDLIAGDVNESEIIKHGEGWYEERGIALQVGERVTGVNPFMKKVKTDAGEYEYDALLVATGASPLVPHIPGRDLRGVFALRHIEDARAILERCDAAHRVAIVGGGPLGIEVAAALTKHFGGALEISIYEREGHLMPAYMDAETAEHLREIVEEAGVKVHLNSEVVGLNGTLQVSEVVAAGGRFHADVVVFAAGIVPNVEPLSSCAMVRKGIVVDSALRVEGTGGKYRDIWAAGDVVEWEGNVYGTARAAVEQAEVAAENIAGGSVKYHGTVRSHTVRCFDTYVTSVGRISGEETLKYREEDLTVKVFLEKGVVVGGIVIGSKIVGVRVDEAVRKGLHVSAIEDILNL